MKTISKIYTISVLTFILLVISGCQSKTWQKKNHSEQEMEKELADCKVQANTKFPPDVKMGVSLGAGVGIGRHSGSSVGIVFSPKDLTKEQREDFIKNCMYNKGWVFDKKAK